MVRLQWQDAETAFGLGDDLESQARLGVAPDDEGEGEGPLLDMPSARWRDLPAVALGDEAGADDDDPG